MKAVFVKRCANRERIAEVIVLRERRAVREAVGKIKRLIDTFEMSFSKEQRALFAALFDMMLAENGDKVVLSESDLKEYKEIIEFFDD